MQKCLICLVVVFIHFLYLVETGHDGDVVDPLLLDTQPPGQVVLHQGAHRLLCRLNPMT